MITQDALRIPSPDNSDTSVDDSDKDTTRVFFGPLKTPEKRFAAIAAIPDPDPDNILPVSSQGTIGQWLPKLGSPAPSDTTTSDEIMDVERLVGLTEERKADAEGPSRVRGEAGYLDDEEPSAVLASKLLRALDNPSPPPSPPPAPINDSLEEEVDTDDAGIGSSQESEILAPVILSHEELPRVHVSPTTPVPSNECDLMNFDSIDSIEEVTMLSPTQQKQANEEPPSPFSFPDAPVLQPYEASRTETFPGQIDILVDVQDDEPKAQLRESELKERGGKASADEENSSVTSLADEPKPGALGKESPARSPPVPDVSHKLAPKSGEAPPDDESPHTPLRRSSRPRKSATPHILKYLAANSPSQDQSSPLPVTPRDSQARKSRKGKERVSSSPREIVFTTVGDDQTNSLDISSLADRPSDMKAQRRYSRSPIRQELKRELGSLSPNSADLLTRLIPSSSKEKEPSAPPSSQPGEQVLETPIGQPSTFSTQDQSSAPFRPEPSTPTPPSPAIRFSTPARVPVTPRRSHIPISPSKLQLQPVSLDDPTRTPARRVPLEEAVAEGRVSPQKMSQMQTGMTASVNIFTGQEMPVLNRSAKHDASPARRVFVAPSSTKHEAVSRPESPSKHHLDTSISRQPSRGKALSAPQKAASESRPGKLPFPLVGALKEQASSEQDNVRFSESPGQSSPSKSSLKQTTSRIPRKKPYSKPSINPIPALVEEKKVPKFATSRTAGIPNPSDGATTSKKASTSTRTTVGGRHEATAPVKRVIRAVDLSKHTTSKTHAPLQSSSPSDATASSSADLASGSRNPVSATGGNLKRKRVESKVGPVASSRTTTLRQVPSVPTTSASSSSGGQPHRTASSSSLRTGISVSSSRNQSQTAQKPVVVKFRKVMPLEPQPQPPSAPKEGIQESNQVHPSETASSRAISFSPSSLGHDMKTSPPAAERHAQSPPLSPPVMEPPPQPLIFLIDPLSPVSEPATLESGTEGVQELNVRRTTRLNKPLPNPPSTVTFTHEPSADSSAPRPQRRRTNAGQHSRLNTDDVFSGMSLNALKVLTANNTVRNQQYAVANLQTEIVRKEGARPESPAVKIKTIVQRQQEEKVKQREARAARRARRHGDDMIGEESVDDGGYESPTPVGDSQELHLGNVLIKHTRGAGDEEDYETPLKNIDGEVSTKRRVKWDKGLFTEVYLDEVVLGSKIPPQENVLAKGCLMASAKKLRLDTLGNLSDLDNNLLNLTQEHVVVKKFVYDDEIEVAPPQPVTPVVRNTRSKTKKAKN